MQSVIPRPRSMRAERGEFVLSPLTPVIADDAGSMAVDWLTQWLPLGAPSAVPQPDQGSIHLQVDAFLAPEHYTLTVRDSGIKITGGSAEGLLFGTTTLLQLLPPEVFRAGRAKRAYTIPAVTIEDEPRFPWRGVLVDVARHFFPKHELLRLIDLFALHKMNVLHLHLTDDQGWRMEVPGYPLLTQVSSWRTETPLGAGETAASDGRPHGGYYSDADLREIVAYAAQRAITIMPEIDLPGHVQSVLAAYPEFGVTGSPVAVGTRWGVSDHVLNMEEATIEFAFSVVDHVLSIFPGPYISIGGDECPTTQWSADARTQELLEHRGLSSVEQLQGWFTQKIAEHVQAHGRRLVGWDELLETDISTSVAITAWRGTRVARIAAERGHHVIAAPTTTTYLDYRQSEDPNEPIPFGSVVDLHRTYSFEPIPDGLSPDAHHLILGGQANIWTENIDSIRTLEYMAFPRLCAIADALWRDGTPYYDQFQNALSGHLQRLKALGVEYRPQRGPQPWQTRPDATGLPQTAEQDAKQIETLTAGIR
ncbi:beta-N-acetylhexosaminidase [Microbacterium nymphoidis]|uniref:beta-N-acetylhexosaminidase n=1 Tax=Microbacterium nymphoidis TaxID=2898586 RepID=UPI001E63474E|nr:beta-N-acetylhexosaminidase [Microbacterium nymphoidis]MCD2498474.1 beta-N-acetylhexosaminidase [Microbacterium nymphoidis]